jgi:hypothetical protein
MAPGQGADGNADGVVDSADYISWRRNLGQPAGVLFSENFDSLPSTSVLDGQNLPGWNVVSPHLQVTSRNAVTAPNGLHGIGTQRGAMFHQAQESTELQFKFFRKENASSNDGGGDSIEIGITQSASLHALYRSLTGSRVAFVTDARSNRQQTVNFTVYGQNGSEDVILADVNLTGSLLDGVWYDGLIRFEADNTVTFGYKPLGTAHYMSSPGHPLPTGFQKKLRRCHGVHHTAKSTRRFVWIHSIRRRYGASASDSCVRH